MHVPAWLYLWLNLCVYVCVCQPEDLNRETVGCFVPLPRLHQYRPLEFEAKRVVRSHLTMPGEKSKLLSNLAFSPSRVPVWNTCRPARPPASFAASHTVSAVCHLRVKIKAGTLTPGPGEKKNPCPLRESNFKSDSSAFYRKSTHLPDESLKTQFGWSCIRFFLQTRWNH